MRMIPTKIIYTDMLLFILKKWTVVGQQCAQLMFVLLNYRGLILIYIHLEIIMCTAKYNYMYYIKYMMYFILLIQGFMNLTLQVLCNVVLQSIRLYFHHHSQPQLSLVFPLAPSLHSFWSYFSTLLQQHIGHYRHGEFIFQCHIFLPFHTVNGVLKASILKWFAIPFSSGPHFVRTLLQDLSILGDPTQHGSQLH